MPRRSSGRGRSRRRRGRDERFDEPLPPLEREPGAPSNAGAVHRSVLTGLVSNIGHLTDEGEYEGAKGTRFRIFPGSALFRQTPAWIVAAELVETTRLYARTVARIRADWVERVAPHLVRREIFEPHWLRDAGQVAAWEKVSYQGLAVIPRRRVPYGPVDPRGARDLFIQNALVDESIRTDGEFLARNRDLIDRLEAEEAKRRKHDVLIDLQARFEFYDARVPADVHSTPSFEKWRRAAEAKEPALLHMRPQDLLRIGADRPQADEFPDHLDAAGMRLRLEYRHDPGGEDDGVTLVVPLAALNQVSAARLEWLVPGMVREKLLALLRGLPKRLRVRFVPAPEYADGAAESLPFGAGSLRDSLARYLSELSGTLIRPQDFQPDDLPSHLRCNVRVVDDAGEAIASGRDLVALRATLGERARSALSSSGGEESLEAGGASCSVEQRSGLTAFDVDALPARVTVRRAGVEVPAFPALIDEGESVSVRLLDDDLVAAAATRLGLRRLFAIAAASEIEPMLPYLPGPDGVAALDRLALLHAPIGPREDLERDLSDLIVDRAFLAEDPEVRDAAAFAARCDAGRARLWSAGETAVGVAFQTLELHQRLLVGLEANHPAAWGPAIEDIWQQLERLVPARFLAATPWTRLQHVPRYLQASVARLAKLTASGHRRDDRARAELRPFEERLREHRSAAPSARQTLQLDELAWLLEELRVSLHAQEIGTAVPISSKRLAERFALVESGGDAS